MNARVLLRLFSGFALGLSAIAASAEPACRTGGTALANAFVRSNAIYRLYIGDLNSYLASNRAHFAADGDAIRCASALSRAFMVNALQLYDPMEIKERELMDAKMRSMGFAPGPQAPSAANIAFSMSMNLSRLARVLPAAAEGNYGPWNTPTNEIERMQLAAEQMVPLLLQNPMVVDVLRSVEPLMREAIDWDYRFVHQATQRLAKM